MYNYVVHKNLCVNSSVLEYSFKKIQNTHRQAMRASNYNTDFQGVAYVWQILPGTPCILWI